MNNRYPLVIISTDGTYFLIRHVKEEDRVGLESFFSALSETERWLSRINTADSKTRKPWFDGTQEEQCIPFVAQDMNDQVIAAYALLERHASPCLAHIAHVRIMVAPGYRARGLGSRMIIELSDLASCMGIEKVVAEFAGDMEEVAIKAALRLNFVKQATLKDYIKDSGGGFHDLVIMVKTIGPCPGDF